jgi:acyl carrier protein
MPPPTAATVERLRELIVATLNLGIAPSDIDPERPLMESGHDLDSVDVLELVVAIETEFGIDIDAQELGRDTFRSVHTLAEFVEAARASS